MSNSKGKPITAYGLANDRLKLAVLAASDGRSQSSWVIETIRSQYEAKFGDLPPENVKCDQLS